jgi:hypothetical protein
MVDSKRAMMALAGAWLGGVLLLTAWTVIAAFMHVQILDHPEAQANRLLNQVGAEDVPAIASLLRHEVALVLRSNYLMAEILQGMLGASLLALYLGTADSLRPWRIAILVSLLLLVAVEAFALRPRADAAMRRWEFAIPGEVYVAQETMLNAALPYAGAEAVKVVLLALFSFQTLLTPASGSARRRKRSSRRSVDEWMRESGTMVGLDRPRDGA